MLPTPSIFTMRFMASLPAFPESAFESMSQQGQPFSDSGRRYASHLVFVLPLLQCAVGFPSVVRCQPFLVIPHPFGRCFAGSGRTEHHEHSSGESGRGCFEVLAPTAPCWHAPSLIPLSGMR